MAEKILDLPFPEPPAEEPLEETALRRHYTRQGRLFDSMRLSIANLAQEGVFVYSIQIRWPTEKKAGFTLICKALTADGPKITFHNDYQWAAVMLGFAGRLRGGAVEWHEDNFPPDGWEDQMAFYHKRQIYID